MSLSYLIPHRETIALNPMVLRQTAESRFSHFDGGWEEMWQAIAERSSEQAADLLRADGKILKLDLGAELSRRFFSGVTEIGPQTPLNVTFAQRPGAVADEAPYVQVTAGGTKARAGHAVAILYHRDALTIEERTRSDTGTSVDGDWQIVSVNASPGDKPEPPTPMAMARNMAKHLGLPQGIGGTARVYTAEEFMEAILFWSRHAMTV